MSQHFLPATPPAPLPAPVPARSGTKPKNNMTMAMVSLLGAWPLAVVAIRYARSVDIKWYDGDPVGASRAAGRAANWAIASWALTAVIVILMVAAG